MKTKKLFKENIGEKLHDIGFDIGFLDMTIKTQTAKVKINWAT